MDNQHRKISGYRELSEQEVALINDIKAHGVKLGEFISLLEMQADVDKRWIAIGKTDLQKGLMALTRAVAKPTFF
jgi:hypothetical protein